eukprot:scaffold27882_cov122-Isochrysis_galbana.AAC.5
MGVRPHPDMEHVVVHRRLHLGAPKQAVELLLAIVDGANGARLACSERFLEHCPLYLHHGAVGAVA